MFSLNLIQGKVEYDNAPASPGLGAPVHVSSTHNSTCSCFPSLQLLCPLLHPCLSLCPGRVPQFHVHSPDHPQCQVPCHPGCPNAGEEADPKRTGCRGETFGSDDGGGTAEIHSKTGGAGQEEEGGKNPVKRWFGCLLKSFPCVFRSR